MHVRLSRAHRILDEQTSELGAILKRSLNEGSEFKFSVAQAREYANHVKQLRDEAELQLSRSRTLLMYDQGDFKWALGDEELLDLIHGLPRPIVRPSPDHDWQFDNQDSV